MEKYKIRSMRPSTSNAPPTTTRYRLFLGILGLVLFSIALSSSFRQPLSTFLFLTERNLTQEEPIATQPSTQQPPSIQRNQYAIYMTTHMSDEHKRFLTQCWPAAIQRLPLLQQADFVVYTSLNETHSLNQLFFDTLQTPTNRVNIHRYKNQLQDYNGNWKLQKQEGAVLAMVDPFLPHNHWFDEYEWVIRLNPDVLIRRDDWLLQTMQNNTIDAIFVDWRQNFRNQFPKALHSDFYAFRPQKVNSTAWIDAYQQQTQAGRIHAESHVYAGVEHMIAQERMAWLPKVEGNFRFARTGGPSCDVIHNHGMLSSCPNYFDAVV